MQVKKIDEAEWRAYLADCTTGTFFHSPEWYQVWEKYAGYDYEAKMLCFDSGRKVLFPYCWRWRLKGLVKEIISSPVGTYGGGISQSELLDKEKKELENYFLNFRLLQFRANPLNGILAPSFFTQQDFTQIIQLEEDTDKVLEKWSDNHLRSLKKGLKSGLSIHIADCLSDWKEYFNIYQDSLRRWGKNTSSRYNWMLFETLSHLDSEVCRLWLVRKDLKLVAGCICFYQKTHIVYWHGASLESSFHLKPNHVLHYYIIKNAVENKFKWYDFNPSGGHRGVIKFKEGFGAVKIASDIYHRQPYLLKKLFEIRRKIKTKSVAN